VYDLSAVQVGTGERHLLNEIATLRFRDRVPTFLQLRQRLQYTPQTDRARRSLQLSKFGPKLKRGRNVGLN